MWLCPVCAIIAKNKHISWRVLLGSGDCPLSSVSLYWWKYVSSTNSCIISKKKNMKTQGGLESLVIWCASVYCIQLGPTVDLRTTCTQGRQCVLLVCCVQFLSVMSSVSLSLPVSLFIFRWMCIGVRFQCQLCDVLFSKFALWPYQCTWKNGNSWHSKTKSKYVWLNSLHCLAWHIFCSDREQTELLGCML